MQEVSQKPEKTHIRCHICQVLPCVGLPLMQRGEKLPFYLFDYGQSYTEFSYSDLTVTPKTKADETVEIGVTVRNCGERDGEEVVQLYVTDELVSMIRSAS